MKHAKLTIACAYLSLFLVGSTLYSHQNKNVKLYTAQLQSRTFPQYNTTSQVSKFPMGNNILSNNLIRVFDTDYNGIISLQEAYKGYSHMKTVQSAIAAKQNPIRLQFWQKIANNPLYKIYLEQQRSIAFYRSLPSKYDINGDRTIDIYEYTMYMPALEKWFSENKISITYLEILQTYDANNDGVAEILEMKNVLSNAHTYPGMNVQYTGNRMAQLFDLNKDSMISQSEVDQFVTTAKLYLTPTQFTQLQGQVGQGLFPTLTDKTLTFIDPQPVIFHTPKTRIRWYKVNGATEYVLTIKKNNTTVLEETVPTTPATINGINNNIMVFDAEGLTKNTIYTIFLQAKDSSSSSLIARKTVDIRDIEVPEPVLHAITASSTLTSDNQNVIVRINGRVEHFVATTMRLEVSDSVTATTVIPSNLIQEDGSFVYTYETDLTDDLRSSRRLVTLQLYKQSGTQYYVRGSKSAYIQKNFIEPEIEPEPTPSELAFRALDTNPTDNVLTAKEVYPHIVNMQKILKGRMANNNTYDLNGNNILDHAEYANIYTSVIRTMAVREKADLRVLNVYDKDHSGTLELQEVLDGYISISQSNSQKGDSQYNNIYDINNNGIVTNIEVAIFEAAPEKYLSTTEYTAFEALVSTRNVEEVVVEEENQTNITLTDPVNVGPGVSVESDGSVTAGFNKTTNPMSFELEFRNDTNTGTPVVIDVQPGDYEDSGRHYLYNTTALYPNSVYAFRSKLQAYGAQWSQPYYFVTGAGTIRASTAQVPRDVRPTNLVITEQNGTYNLEWDTVTNAQAYEVAIVKNNSEFVHMFTVNGTDASKIQNNRYVYPYTQFEDGQEYHFVLRAVGGGVITQRSISSRVRVHVTENDSDTISNVINTTVSAPTGSTQDVAAHWSPVRNARDYRVIYSEQRNGVFVQEHAQTIRPENLTNSATPSYEPPLSFFQETLTYKVEVQTTLNNGTVLPKVESVFTIGETVREVPFAQQRPVISGPTTGTMNPLVQWSGVPGATAYRIAMSSNGQNILNTTVSASQLNTSAPSHPANVQLVPGRIYTTYVTAIKGTETSQRSEYIFAAGVGTAGDNSTGQLMRSRQEIMSIDHIPGSKSLTVHWNKMDGAGAYELFMQSDNASNSESMAVGNPADASHRMTANGDEMSYTISDLDEGATYTIKVRGIGAGRATGYSPATTKAVEERQAITSPTILEPTGTTNAQGATLRWQAVDNATSYKLEIREAGASSNHYTLDITPSLVQDWHNPSRTLGGVQNGKTYTLYLSAWNNQTLMGTSNKTITFSDPNANAAEQAFRARSASISTPTENAEYSPGSIEVRWSKVEGAVSYSIQKTDMSTNSATFTTVNVADLTDTNNPSVHIEFPEGDTSFNLNITARSAEGWISGTSTARTFRTRPIVVIPEVDTNFSPNITYPSGQSVTTENPIIWWDKVEHAGGYRISIRNKDTFAIHEEANIGPHSGNARSSNYRIATPLTNGTYQIRVQAFSATQQTQWSTIAEITKETPVVEEDEEEEEEVVDISNSQPVINAIPITIDPNNSIAAYATWDRVDGSSEYDVSFEELDTRGNTITTLMRTIQAVEGPSGTVDGNGFNMKPLIDFNKNYRIKVRAKNNISTGQWSNWNAFSTDADPSIPVNIQGEKAVITGPTNPVTKQAAIITWDPIIGATHYEIQLNERVVNQTATLVRETITVSDPTVPSFDATQLVQETEYDVQYTVWIRAKNSISTGIWSDKKEFTIGGANGDPGELEDIRGKYTTIIAPTGDRIDPVDSVLRWEKLNGALEYEVWVQTNRGVEIIRTRVRVTDANIQNPSLDISDLVSEQTGYKAWVRAWQHQRQSLWSSRHDFYVRETPPPPCPGGTQRVGENCVPIGNGSGGNGSGGNGSGGNGSGGNGSGGECIIERIELIQRFGECRNIGVSGPVYSKIRLSDITTHYTTPNSCPSQNRTEQSSGAYCDCIDHECSNLPSGGDYSILPRALGGPGWPGDTAAGGGTGGGTDGGTGDGTGGSTGGGNVADLLTRTQPIIPSNSPNIHATPNQNNEYNVSIAWLKPPEENLHIHMYWYEVFNVRNNERVGGGTVSAYNRPNGYSGVANVPPGRYFFRVRAEKQRTQSEERTYSRWAQKSFTVVDRGGGSSGGSNAGGGGSNQGGDPGSLNAPPPSGLRGTPTGFPFVGINTSWQAVTNSTDEVKTYEIEYTNVTTNSAPQLATSVRLATTVHITRLTAGNTYRLRARSGGGRAGGAVGQYEKYSAWSAPITVAIPANTTSNVQAQNRSNAVIDITKERPKIAQTSANTTAANTTLEWSKISGATGYQVYVDSVSANGKRTNVLDTTVTASSLTDQNSPSYSISSIVNGNTNYRVWIRGTNGTMLSLWSTAMNFTVTGNSQNTTKQDKNVSVVGQRPIISGPNNPATNRDAIVSWNTIPGATKYYIWLKEKNIGSNQTPQTVFNAIITPSQLSQPTFDASNIVTSGKEYTVWVQPHNNAGKGEWSYKHIFSVR